MSGTGERKRSYFGTFVDALSKSSASDAGEQRGDVAVRQFERAVPPVKSPNAASQDLRDVAVLALAPRGGSARIDELLAPPFDSIGQLMEVIGELQRFGLAEVVNDIVRLSDTGRSVAVKLGAELAPPRG